MDRIPHPTSDIVGLLEKMLAEHRDHPWHKVSRCVYCGPCGVRLYQGDLPEGHPVWVPPKKPRPPSLREKWGMD